MALRGATGAASAGSGVLEPNFQTYRSGAWYGLQVAGVLASAGAVVGGAGGAANSPIYACPLPVRRTVTISQLGMVVGTAVAGVTGKMALYGGDLLAGAGTLVAACVGTVDMASVANTQVSLSFSASQTIAPGLYWACAMFDGAAQPYNFSTGVSALGELGQILGAPGINGLVRAALASQALRVTSANVDYAQAFPAAFGTATVGANTPSSPYMAMLVA